jgi:methylthioribose-1-phosphate isomerase
LMRAPIPCRRREPLMKKRRFVGETKREGLVPTIDYVDGKALIIDQTLLPEREVMLEIGTLAGMAEAIRSLKVRGAPAIGIAAAYGILLALEEHAREHEGPGFRFCFDHVKGMVCTELPTLDAGGVRNAVGRAARMLERTRPTAVNLFWALRRMEEASASGAEPLDLYRSIGERAFRIHDEELEIEAEIGRNGASLIENGMNVITHCNAGGLAAAGLGTALAVLYAAFEQGKRFHVFAGETRPLLQGARLTAWELRRRGIDVTVICDSAAATLLSRREIGLAIVGADRIAGNGDVANKIGTLGLAVLCEKYGVPFYVAAPWSTFDPELGSGADIPIEERPSEEVTGPAGRRTVPRGVPVFNPAFDVTPAQLIAAIICERGIIEHPDRRSIAVLSRK